MTSSCDLIVVGAGPTGLTLALQAATAGVDVRIFERRSEPRARAPALAIHPRTMEVLRGLGVAEGLMMRGLAKVDLAIHVDDSVVSGSLGDLRLPPTEFPFVLFAPQPEVETLLREKLASIGVEVEWESTFRGFHSQNGLVVGKFDSKGQGSLVHARYLAGCDGVRSAVRDQAGIIFRGRSYRETISIADIGSDDDLQPATAHAFITGEGILFFFPLPSGRWRLIGPGADEATAEGVRDMVERHIGERIGIGEVEWVELVRPQHRLADHYRRGSVFLAGDAAHVHSPAGAQGMNTGIQDAVNLGWKLASVLGGAPEALLDTYEEERRPVAKHVVRLTGLAFAVELSELALLRWARRWAALSLARLLLPHPGLVSIFARVVSGLDTRYRVGPLVEPRGIGRYQPGRRLPDRVIHAGAHSRIHHHIEPDRFSLLVFNDAIDSDQAQRLADDYPGVLRLSRIEPANRKSPAWALVRPDGYIAVSGEQDDLGAARRFLTNWLGESRLRDLLCNDVR